MNSVHKLQESTSAAERLRREVERYVGPVDLALDQERLTRLINPQVSDLVRDLRNAHLGLSPQQLERLKDPLFPYRRLQLQDVTAGLSMGAAGDVAAWAEKGRLAHADWAARMANMVFPWAKVNAQVQSVRALTELGSIGAALKRVHPFDDAFTSVLRADLGDWRASPDPNSLVYVDAHARATYYYEQGFDPALTDFGEEAFAEGLNISELCENYLEDESLAEFVPPSSSPEEAAALKRANKCQEYMFAMEYKLRRFIHRKMVEQFGEDWPKKRLDPKLLQMWSEKEEAARAAGRRMEILIEAADFTDYEGILVKKDNFRLMFAGHFREQAAVQETFRRLRPLRLDAMHARSISKEDLLLAVAECIRIMRAIDSAS